jgi:hypothetical protein
MIRETLAKCWVEAAHGGAAVTEPRQVIGFDGGRRGLVPRMFKGAIPPVGVVVGLCRTTLGKRDRCVDLVFSATGFGAVVVHA